MEIFILNYKMPIAIFVKKIFDQLFKKCIVWKFIYLLLAQNFDKMYWQINVNVDNNTWKMKVPSTGTKSLIAVLNCRKCNIAHSNSSMVCSIHMH